MNYAEALVLKRKNHVRLQQFKDLKFKILGKDRFENKNNFIDLNIENSLKYFTASGNITDSKENSKIRKQLWKN